MKAPLAFLPELPLVDRELRILGRRFSTYFARSAFPLVIFVMMTPTAFMLAFNPNTFGDAAATLGRGLLNIVLGLQLFVALAVATSTSTSLMLVEKEENALALLVMASQSDWDIVLSKFLAGYIHVFLLILGLVPIQSMALILGGGDIGVTVIGALLVLALAAAVAAVGLYAATVCDRSGSAAALVIVILAVWLVPTGFLDIEAHSGGSAWAYTNPVAAVVSLSPAVAAGGGWITALVLTLAVFTLALFAARRALERAIRSDGAVKVRAKRPPSNRRYARPRREPIAALIGAASLRSRWSSHPVVWIFRFGAAFLASMLPFLGWLVFFSIASRSIVHALAAMRENQTWADISLIPDDERTLSAGVVRAFRGETLYIAAAGILGLAAFERLFRFDSPLWLLALMAVYYLLFYRACLLGAVAAGLLPYNRRRCEHAASYRILLVLVGGWFVGAMTPMSVVEFIRWRVAIGALDVRFDADWFDSVYVILVGVMIAWNFALLLLMSANDNRLIRRRLRRVYR